MHETNSRGSPLISYVDEERNREESAFLADRNQQCSGTSLIRKRHPPRTSIGPYTQAYRRVLGAGVFL